MQVDKLQHEMYWNRNKSCINKLVEYDKLQHEMYWNNVSDTVFDKDTG